MYNLNSQWFFWSLGNAHPSLKLIFLSKIELSEFIQNFQELVNITTEAWTKSTQSFM